METIKIQYTKETTPRIIRMPQGDWIDLAIPIDIYAAKHKNQQVDLEIAMKLPEGYEAHIIPRSSTFKKWGIMLVNSVGMIDESYCGPEDTWKAHIVGSFNCRIPKGTRLFQFRIVKKQPKITIEEVEKLLDPNRGGVGSTGD